jgi:hypothetical protein
MDACDVRKRILDRYGIRVEPAMSEYALRKLRAASALRNASFAIMGGDARTGIPVRQMINPSDLSPSTIPASLFEL